MMSGETIYFIYDQNTLKKNNVNPLQYASTDQKKKKNTTITW